MYVSYQGASTTAARMPVEDLRVYKFRPRPGYRRLPARSRARFVYPPPGRGVGALTGTAATIASAAGTAATVTGALVASLAAIPIAGPIAAGIVAVGELLANIFSGCGQTCVQATDIANQVGDALTQNLNVYMSAPVHYASLQAAALNNFDSAWSNLVAACGAPALGSAGQACISERQQGACYWKASPGGWSQDAAGVWTYTGYGPAGSGTACWNYFVGMRDPIANDPTVVPDPVGSSVASATGSLLSVFGINPSSTIAGIPISDLALPAALILLGLLL